MIEIMLLRRSSRIGKSRSHARISLSFIPLLLIGIASPAFAQDCDGHSAVHVLFEDDTGIGKFTPFGPSDHYYTAGAQVGVSRPPYDAHNNPRWIDNYLPWLLRDRCHRNTWNAGGSMYTPTNLKDPNVIKTDRPYAGWAYLSYVADRYSPDLSDTQHLAIYLGSTGPRVGGRQVQDWVHSDPNIGAVIPQGWSHQIQNHIGYFAEYRRRHQFGRNDYVDLGLFEGGALGNVFIYPDVGTIVRFGVHIKSTYPSPRLLASLSPEGVAPSLPTPQASRSHVNWLSFYAFGQATGDLVLRNMFLNGQLVPPADRYTIDRKVPVAQFEGGLVLRLAPISFTYREVTTTPEFAQQNRWHNFGSLTLTVGRTKQP